MDTDHIEVPYNDTLKPLEEVLARVRRPGDFFAVGSLEAPMPRVDVNGVGVVVPALQKLGERGRGVIGDAEGERLWLHAADALIAQSEHPPAPPRDWRQNVKLSCTCADCCELAAFAADPVEQTHRFRMRKDRGRHLHGQIDGHSIDMTHVTERKGSPQTLVCAKTRWTYERRCAEYRQDVAALATLAELVSGRSRDFAAHCARIAAARERAAPNAGRARAGRARR